MKARLLERVRLYVDELGFGEPVRYAEVIAALMEEPGVVDVRAPAAAALPARLRGVVEPTADPVELLSGANVELQVNQVPVFAGSADDLERVRVRSR